MSAWSLRRQAAAAAVVAALLSAGLSGCNFSHDPAKTVTVVVSGAVTQQDRDKVQEALKGMTDGMSSFITYTSSGDQMTVQVSPVSDVQKFTQKINFGKVDQVDGRTVKVTFIR